MATWSHSKQTHVSHTGLLTPEDFDLRKKKSKKCQPDAQQNLGFKLI